MAGQAILVTGANGQVGRACVAALARAGHDVVAVARADAPRSFAVDLARPFAEGLAAIEERAAAVPSAIVHLAAAVPHDPRYPDGEASAAITRAIDRHVDEAAAAWGARVVYMSSCAIYDSADLHSKRPTSPLRADPSPYVRAKYEGERLFAARDAVSLRLSAPAGAFSRPNLVFGRFAQRAREGLPIELWGSGRREQDFIALDDVCDLVVQAVGASTGGVYNCASGKPTTMAELAEATVAFYERGSVRFADREDPLGSETARYDIADTLGAFVWSPNRDLFDMLRAFEASRGDGGA